MCVWVEMLPPCAPANDVHEPISSSISWIPPLDDPKVGLEDGVGIPVSFLGGHREKLCPAWGGDWYPQGCKCWSMIANILQEFLRVESEADYFYFERRGLSGSWSGCSTYEDVMSKSIIG